MREFEYSDHLKIILKKLYKKDKVKYEAIIKKVVEIVNSPDPNHYKNLRYDMKDCKSVHIGHFVLVFTFIREENKIKFVDFDHHDNIYNK